MSKRANKAFENRKAKYAARSAEIDLLKSKGEWKPKSKQKEENIVYSGYIPDYANAFEKFAQSYRDSQKAREEILSNINVVVLKSNVAYPSGYMYSEEVCQRIVDDWNSGLFDNKSNIYDRTWQESNSEPCGYVKDLKYSEGNIIASIKINKEGLSGNIRSCNYCVAVDLSGTIKGLLDKKINEVKDAFPIGFSIRNNPRHDPYMWYTVVGLLPDERDAEVLVEPSYLQDGRFVLE